mmetsp:Transcript_127234/g.406882  ORF Transcript_127234/g.406882 Transcript_127234/m.406882 type:complete len:205 (+) Transcript_127234:705-1319(+)
MQLLPTNLPRPRVLPPQLLGEADMMRARDNARRQAPSSCAAGRPSPRLRLASSPNSCARTEMTSNLRMHGSQHLDVFPLAVCDPGGSPPSATPSDWCSFDASRPATTSKKCNNRNRATALQTPEEDVGASSANSTSAAASSRAARSAPSATNALAAALASAAAAGVGCHGTHVAATPARVVFAAATATDTAASKARMQRSRQAP